MFSKVYFYSIVEAKNFIEILFLSFVSFNFTAMFKNVKAFNYKFSLSKFCSYYRKK